MKAFYALVCLALLAGCVSPYKESDGKYLKLAAPEERSPFGTNFVFARLQRCDGPQKKVLFYMDKDFSNCEWLKPEEQFAWQHGYSQGQGGQIVEGAMNAGALGGLAAVKSGGSAAASATVTAVQGVTVIGKGHRK